MSRSGFLLLFGFIVLLSTPVAFAQTTCPKCKQTIEDGYRFCPHDGAELPLTLPQCSACQRELSPMWRFCPFDGTPASAETGARTPTATATVTKLGTPTPLSAVNKMLDAVAAADRDALRLCYDWPLFFPSTTAAELEATTEAYLTRVLGSIGGQLTDTKRVLMRVNLSGQRATLAVTLIKQVRDSKLPKTTPPTYTFELRRGYRGWLITKVTP